MDNVKLSLEIKKKVLKLNISEEEIDKRVRETIDLVGLRGFENYFPHQISTGMKQRVAIARALAVDPDMLLMDEPFASLDAQTRWILHIKLLEIWSKLRKTVLFVTHNVEEAVYLADRVIVLSKRPAKVARTILIDLKRPRNKLSSDFIKYREEIIDVLRTQIPEI
ncbi:MAG: Trehalose/maltose import ATP-binding protein MalK [Candidatus Bathyarchaeota archaeon BA2]|nr:MAG: Trehalose/maltose import ATP-binding protein MalK [Candidatus Bathyarchaeota archaeon BA2]